MNRPEVVLAFVVSLLVWAAGSPRADSLDDTLAKLNCTDRRPGESDYDCEARAQVAFVRDLNAARTRQKAADAKFKATCAHVVLGMTTRQVERSCWGKPDHKNVTVTASSRSEQWVYDRAFLYFTDDILRSAQVSDR